MNKKIIISLTLIVIIAIGVAIFIFSKNKNKNNQETQVETPPTVQKVNSLPLAQRPYVELIPHANKATCDGVDMKITNLKNNETKAEYELEYTTKTLIQGVFGRREFNDGKTEHAPLEFGTCSKGKCVCNDDINGGSLKLTISGNDSQNYVLKGDFSVLKTQVSDNKLKSKDLRLSLDLGTNFTKGTNVMLSSTLGLPADLTDKVILGPYGIFVEDSPELKNPIKAEVQSQEIANAKIQLWDGSKWEILQATVDGEKASFEIAKLGVLVVTE